jgi:glycosyltransferase involved in cell wall biosynthesis
MKLLFICGREIDYTRNQVLLRAFRRIGEVDTVVESGIVKSLVFRSARIAFRAFPKYISKRYDLTFVGFYGHLLMIPVGLFGKRPIVFDAFVSTYDTLTSDRRSFTPKSIIGRMAAILDKSTCHFASKVLVDTPAQELYFSSILSVPANKLYSLPVSCNEEIFYPRTNPLNHKNTLVLSYSSYLPIHGIETIIQAAMLLKNEPIQFKLIGEGPLYKSLHEYADELGLKNVTFTPPISLQRLADEISIADICLGGHFGTSDKASRVVPGKIYQMLAMAKPVIAADSPANKVILEHGISAYLCPPGNPQALAKAILDLYRDPQLCIRLGIGAREIYEKYCSEAVVTEKLRKIIGDMINTNLSQS